MDDKESSKNALITKLQDIIDFESNDIHNYYRSLCCASADIRELIPIDNSIYQIFKIDMECLYNQTKLCYKEYEAFVIKNCNITLSEIIAYLIS
jgi:hypothetical protein